MEAANWYLWQSQVEIKRCCVHYHGSSLAQNFLQGQSSYALGKLMNTYMYTYHIHTVRMSPALNGSSVLERFKRGNAIKIHDGIMFDFYPGLPLVSVCFAD